MPFTLETWKAQVYERLWDWRLRLEQARPASSLQHLICHGPVAISAGRTK